MTTPRGGLGAWVRATRPLAAGNLLPYLFLGQALAYATTGRFAWLWVAAAVLWGVIDQAAILWANDAADADDDAHNDTFNVFSGGSRVVPDGALTPRALLRGASAAAVALLALSIAAAFTADRTALPALAVVALGLSFAYSLPPPRLAYRGLGPTMQGLGVGVVLPVVGYHLQSPELAALPTAALVPTFLLGLTGNVVTALPDTPADRRAGKRTWPVARGETAARRDALVLTAVALLAIPAVGPPLPALAFGAVLAPPAAMLAAAVPLARDADATDRPRCLRFVTLVAGAGGVAVLGWTAALALGG